MYTEYARHTSRKDRTREFLLRKLVSPPKTNYPVNVGVTRLASLARPLARSKGRGTAGAKSGLSTIGFKCGCCAAGFAGSPFSPSLPLLSLPLSFLITVKMAIRGGAAGAAGAGGGGGKRFEWVTAALRTWM